MWLLKSMSPQPAVSFRSNIGPPGNHWNGSGVGGFCKCRTMRTKDVLAGLITGRCGIEEKAPASEGSRYKGRERRGFPVWLFGLVNPIRSGGNSVVQESFRHGFFVQFLCPVHALCNVSIHGLGIGVFEFVREI